MDLSARSSKALWRAPGATQLCYTRQVIYTYIACSAVPSLETKFFAVSPSVLLSEKGQPVQRLRDNEMAACALLPHSILDLRLSGAFSRCVLGPAEQMTKQGT